MEVLEMSALVPMAELGIEIVDRPAEANVLVVTGGANLKSRLELENAYREIREPRVVIAVGACAATMGIFKGGYAMMGPIDAIIPVNLYIMGCPPRPQVIINALADAFHLNSTDLDALLQTPEGFRGDPHVDHSKCMGCGACVHVCPADAIDLLDRASERVVRFTRQDCIYCASCADVCPSQAVALDYREKPWFRHREASRSEATLTLETCLVCGAPYAPRDQMRWALTKIDETLRMDEAVRAKLRRSVGVCTTCRRTSIAEVRRAKIILASLATQAHARRSAASGEPATPRPHEKGADAVEG